MMNLGSLVSNYGNAKDSENEKIFQSGKQVGVKVGIGIGMKRHFELTSELSEEETKKFREFMFENNLVVCYSEEYDGFRVRKNDKLNHRLPTVHYVIDRDEKYEDKVNEASFSLSGNEVMNMKVNEIRCNN